MAISSDPEEKEPAVFTVVRLLDRQAARRTRARHHVLDHLHQAHLHAVVGVVDALDAVGLQLADLLRGDGAAAAAEHA
jgi:hypothetical protein